MKKKRTKVIVIILVLIGVMVLAGFGFYWATVTQYRSEMETMTLTHTDATGIPDGTYIGDCDVTLIHAKVEVTVKDGEMTDIKLLEHDNGRGTPAESIIETIMNAQTLKVDDISGATNSSLVIKKAIDNALSGAK
jgi:uncharacterized protein with FMN-binding domain